LDEADMCTILTTVRVPASISVWDLRDRLRQKSIIIYEGKGCFAGKVFQVGNIGELSDDDVRYFLTSLRDVLLTLQSETADVVAPLKPKAATAMILPIQPNELAGVAS
jgi:2-aminoethylphosphonate-pyruvate transaminase